MEAIIRLQVLSFSSFVLMHLTCLILGKCLFLHYNLYLFNLLRENILTRERITGYRVWFITAQPTESLWFSVLISSFNSVWGPMMDWNYARDWGYKDVWWCPQAHGPLGRTDVNKNVWCWNTVEAPRKSEGHKPPLKQDSDRLNCPSSPNLYWLR